MDYNSLYFSKLFKNILYDNSLVNGIWMLNEITYNAFECLHVDIKV